MEGSAERSQNESDLTSNSLRLAVAQPECIPSDITANAALHAATISGAQAQVVVFPELSITGYELEAADVAEDDPRLSPISAACAQAGAVALVGAPVKSDGGSNNAMLRIDADGASVAYRKMWLGGSEPRRFVPGAHPAVIEVNGWRLGLAICKDTGVMEHAALTAARGIDAYVAGVLDHRHDADTIEERAVRIATEHRVWVALASFAGSTGGGYRPAAGRSGIWAPDGRAVVRAGDEPGAVVVGLLKLRQRRRL